MSKNRNRAKLNKAQNGREYQNIMLSIEYPMYWDEGIVSHSKVKFLMSYKQREFKSWKYNRKTQWKKYHNI